MMTDFQKDAVRNNNKLAANFLPIPAVIKL